jgi:hypothetical protein
MPRRLVKMIQWGLFHGATIPEISSSGEPRKTAEYGSRTASAPREAVMPDSGEAQNETRAPS